MSSISAQLFTRPQKLRVLADIVELRLGQLTLLIVMDHAESRLKDAVRFINRATHFSCLIAEVTLFEAGDQELVAVDLYGQEIVDEKPPVGGTQKMDRATFVRVKTGSGRKAEAEAFVAAFESFEADGGATYASPAGFYIQGQPSLPFHYLAWLASTEKLEIWAPGDLYELVKAHLKSTPSPWQDRIEVRTLKEGGQFGKVADVDGSQVTKSDDFLNLFRYYLSAPTESVGQ
ncbi:MAG: hypothetical protein GY769_16060 [bacterium]|nr:hypothetical protein [bacterium]